MTVLVLPIPIILVVFVIGGAEVALVVCATATSLALVRACEAHLFLSAKHYTPPTKQPHAPKPCEVPKPQVSKPASPEP